MGLLAPWFLTGLAALGIPVFVHLLRNHVTTPRPVSSLMFFERGTQSSTRHRRLRYLLLFTLRLLIPFLLVLAFVNPFVRRPADASRSLLLIVVDNSFSMRAGTEFADAKRQAEELLARKPRQQRAQVIALGGQSQILTEPIADANQLKSALDSIEVGDGHATFAGLARSVRTLSESNPVPIELHLFSDLQKSAMPENFSEAVFPPAVKLTLHAVGGDSGAANWTIDSVAAPSNVTDPKNETIAKVKTVIAGLGTTEAEKTVSLSVNGRAITSKKVRVGAGDRAPVEFSLASVEYGFNRCEIRVDGEDALPADNTARFVVRRTDPQRVLFVHSGSDARSVTYFDAALHAASGDAYVLQPVATEQTTDLDPARFAFTVLADTTALPSIFEHALEQYVAKGGNVMVALGLNAGRRPHIPLWPAPVRQQRTFVSTGAASVGQVDFTFPALEQQQPGRENGGWAGTKVWYAASVDDNGARVAARLNEGTPLLLDRKLGEGHVLLLTTGLDGVTNNLPLQPVFVAFVDKASQYLSGSWQMSGTRLVDSFVQLRSATDRSQQSTGVEVVDPDGKRPLSLNEAKTIQAFRLAHAGFYQIRLANGRDATVGVNADHRESDLAPMTQEMRSLWVGSNAEEANSRTDAAPEARFQQTGLWWYFMLLALGVAIAETLVSGRYLSTDREEL
jgi:hypothetical protein